MREKGRQGRRGEKECRDEEGRLGRLRNVVGAEIRGIHSIMGGSYSGQYQSVQTPHFTLNYNHCANDDEDKKLFTFQNTQEQVYIAPQVHLSKSVAVCFSLWPYVALADQ